MPVLQSAYEAVQSPMQMVLKTLEQADRMHTQSPHRVVLQKSQINAVSPGGKYPQVPQLQFSPDRQSMTSLLMQATPEKRIVTKPLEGLSLDVDLAAEYADLHQLSSLQALQAEPTVLDYNRASAFEKSSDRMSPAYLL